MIGLKRGIVELADHDFEWKAISAETIKRLWDIFGSAAEDIQHVGSTAIIHIKAKPIIDIAVAVDDFAVIEPLIPAIEKAGFIYRPEGQTDWQRYVVLNDSNGLRTHNIHVVLKDRAEWKNYLLFRDFLNANPDVAREYETVKLSLMDKFKYDRTAYVDGKTECCTKVLRLAQIWTDFDRKFTQITPIAKGWSEDKKYCVTTTDGTKYLLRITPISRYETRKSLFAMLEQVAALDIPMCMPVEFGTCDDNANSVGGVYALHSWINGEDLEVVLPRLSETEQYMMGLKSGEILRIIHSIPEPDNEIDYLPYRKNWADRFNRKADRNIKLYQECALKADGGENFIRYINENRELLENRPQCFQHGDYHVGNMMIENGELYIIDFDRYDYGDPWEEFNRIVWSASASPHFATGQLRGYFGGEPPLEFFKLLAFYIASTYVGSLSWAIGFGQQEIDITLNQAKDILQWFDDFKNLVPTWYLKDFRVQWIDGIPYKLKAPFDFSFISKYGKVFKVFDDQDSGNICFGVVSDEGKYFVKFAGAPTARANVNEDEAVERMKNTVQIYRDLEHPVLSKLIKAEEIGGGFATVFEWTDGECMGRQYPLSREKFVQMPVEIRLNIFDDILDFHAYVSKQGYVAIDFYDGSIMYDFNKNKTVICDIEFYSKTPYINNMGRMWGSSRFMSPEEFQLGASIDEITNVYAMGATAFALFGDDNPRGGERDRIIEKWRLSEELFYLAKQAVSDDRNMRQQSVKQFIEEWKMAKAEKI